MDAAVDGLASARELVGLSGARVLLASRDGRNFFVRKIAADDGVGSASSDRLRQQAHKQRTFAAANIALRTPRVLDEGIVGGRYYFDMEYVRGVDGASVLRRASFAEINVVADKLCSYLRAAHERKPQPPERERDTAKRSSSAGSVRAPDVFEALFARVCLVERRCGALGAKRLGRLLYGLDALRERAPSTATLCHGDLTLENLVVDAAGDVWAIDLLDAPSEHWWFDVAKLHQDLQGGWYLRNQATIALGVVEHVSRRVLEEAERLTPGYRDIHDVLVAATFARVLPYARDEREREFVLERVDHFCERIGT